jgi:hypothetical protein
MKYIHELNSEQYFKYNIIAKKRSRGLISDKEFKKELNKIIKDV